jgi:hypothetical protein
MSYKKCEIKLDDMMKNIVIIEYGLRLFYGVCVYF